MSKVARCMINIGAILTFGWSSWAQSAPGFQIIVNPRNPVDVITKDQISSLFLKKSSSWVDGTEAMPVDQEIDSEVRESFSQEVIGRSATSVGSYWQQVVFAGRELPPVIRLSDASVIDFVREHPGAIGYVSLGTPAEGVKVVDVTHSETGRESESIHGQLK